MMNNCSKIRFVALVMVMLLGTIHVWAYNVSFNVGNGATACPTRTTDANDEVELPSSTKNGMHLVGWFYGNTFYGYAGQKVKITRNITLTAQWADVESGDQAIGTNSKVVDVNNVFSKSYEIKNGEQREFTFRNRRHTGFTEQRWYNWVMWASNSYRTDWGNRKDYFYLNLAPCVRKHITENDDFWANNETTTVYIKDSNGELVSLESDDQWNQFLSDMEYAAVSVKVANYDGKIRVYSVMTANNRTYVYPYEYEKYAINNSVDGSTWVYFSVDHTYITNFTAKDPVGLARVACNLDYTTTYGPRNCSYSMATPEGYYLSEGTMVGLGDKVVYTVDLGYHWTLTKWGNANNYDNPRTVTVNASHVSSGWVSPYATLEYSGIDISTDRIFHLDFEGMTDSSLETVVDYPDGSSSAPEGEPTAGEQGKFYNYGNKGRIMSDPVFGKYYQNLAISPDEYTASKAENFLRYVLTDEEKYLLGSKINEAPEGQRAITIGFWVNGRVAVDYELPLERGSMFSMFSNERFRKADAGKVNPGEEPRFMFDISCNGWVYSYMPNSYYQKDEDGNDVKDEYGNPIIIERINKYFYGETDPVLPEGATPKASLFGRYFAHTQDQRRHKFYDDRRWHYVTYVATEDLKKITMYLDGEKTGELDTRGLEDMQLFEEGGDYPGRVWYLRNIVLGGFTPHGLFFEQQYYSDAALAYDDISIYSRALSQSEIADIISEKGYGPTEWHFSDALKAIESLDSDWEPVEGRDGVYRLNKTITQNQKKSLESDGLTIFSTEGLAFANNYNNSNIYLDLKKGRIGLTRNAIINIPNVKKTEYVHFVVKPDDDVNYPLDHEDIYPNNDPCNYPTRGVSLYGGNDKDYYNVFEVYKNNNDAWTSFRMYSRHNSAVYGNNHNVNSNNNILWLSDIVISPYSLIYTYDKTLSQIHNRETVDYVDVNIINNVMQSYSLPELLVTKNNSQAENISMYAYNADGKPYIRFSSSAPRVAYVDQNGNVTLTGLAGYATIKAELVFDNIHDGLISTAYTIRVTEVKKTYVVSNESNVSDEESAYKVGEQFTVMADDGVSDAITMTMGGWTYADSYSVSGKDVVDSWTKGYGHVDQNDIESIDGVSTASVGTQNATSESLGRDKGSYAPVEESKANNTPWTLPSRGAYLKFEPNKAGVLTAYVLQNGNLDKSNSNNNYSDLIRWRPVYVADETGAIVKDVRVVTNSKISENDNYFKEGRRRAQFIEAEEGTYNQHLKDALVELRDNQHDRFELLINNWENAGWKQKVIETGDGGYMVMSKGIVRYTFNVYPGKTYYIFSNHTKIGYSGYNFEEGKLINTDNFEYNPVRDIIEGDEIVFEDLLNSDSYAQPAFPVGKDVTPVTYHRAFNTQTSIDDDSNKWSSICLPFSMNKKQVEENFGEGTSVVILKEIHDSGELKGKIELIWHTNQDIIAGYPYFILPTKKNITEIKANVTFLDASATPAFAVSSKGITYAHKGDYGYYPDYPYVFEGNFNDENLPAGSYVMANNGNLTKIKKATTAKPFRAYLRCLDAANAKPLTSLSLGDSEGVTTSIEELLQDNGIILESSDVYGVNGVKVRSNTHSLEGLSKGVYVVNGKKYVVK